MKKRIRLEITEQAHEQLIKLQEDYELMDLAAPSIQQIHNKLLEDALTGHKMRIDGENAWKLARMFPNASSLEEASRMMIRSLDKTASSIIEFAEKAFERCKANDIQIPRKMVAEFKQARKTHMSRELDRFTMGLDSETPEERAVRAETVELATIEILTEMLDSPTIKRSPKQAKMISEWLEEAKQKRADRLATNQTGETSK